MNETTYALEGSIFIGGAIVQWLRDKVNMIESAQETSDIAYSLDHNDGLSCTSVNWIRSTSLGSSCTRTTLRYFKTTTQVHIVRAALESMAFQTRDVIGTFKALSKDCFSLLRLMGGRQTMTF